MDLNELIVGTVDNVIASGVIEKTIAAQIEKTVLETIVAAMGKYTDFGKALEKAVAGALKLHGEIDLPSYNDAILKIVARQVETRTNAVIEKQVAERMRELLTPAPESIKLSELVAAFIERVKDRQKSGCVCYGEQGQITLHVKDDGHNFTYVEIDEEKDKPAYKCQIRFGVHKSEIFSLCFGNMDTEKQLFVGPLYNFERQIFQMKAAKTKVILDHNERDIETTYELTEH